MVPGVAVICICRALAGGGFDARTTEDLHFGGFERPDSDPRPKTRKEVMQEIIAKSKLHKLERQKEREEQEDKTDALDKELQFLMRQGLLVQRNRHEDKIAEQAVKADDYDKAVRSLGFEARAQATDRMRSDEDKAKEQLAKYVGKWAGVRGNELLGVAWQRMQWQVMLKREWGYEVCCLVLPGNSVPATDFSNWRRCAGLE